MEIVIEQKLCETRFKILWSNQKHNKFNFKVLICDIVVWDSIWKIDFHL